MPVLADPDVRRVALVRLRVGLGDVLCTVPALRAMRRFRPDLAVTLITWPEMANVVGRYAAYVDELLPFPGIDGIPERRPEPGGWEAFRAAAAASRFDLALQCYGNNPVANAVTEALGARLVGGYAPVGWQPVRDPELQLPYPLHRHELDRHLDLVQRLGVPVRAGDRALEFPLRPADERAGKVLCERYQLVPGEYVILHPGASSPSRRWPPEHFAAVGDALAGRGLRIALSGVAAERGLISVVAGAMSAPAVDLAGATGLGAMAVLLRDAAALVSNDTGTAHLAAAVGGRSVTLFLPGEPHRWAHGGRRHRTVRVDVGCNPCPHLECPIDHRCATAITPDAVTATVEDLLRSQPTRVPPQTSAMPSGRH